jgi:RNA polymerase sigma-70 factor, ECF subfamily
MPPSDEELFERVKHRDAEAFDALSARCRPALEGQLLRMLRDPEAARDLAQEALLRLWTHAEQWAGRGSCRGWLSRVASNLALNHIKSAGRRGARLVPLDLGDAEAASETHPQCDDYQPEALAESAEGERMLSALIEELPPAKRDVVRLAVLLENDLEEVSASLSLPRGTVKSRLHYARKLLLARWKEIDTE